MTDNVQEHNEAAGIAPMGAGVEGGVVDQSFANLANDDAAYKARLDALKSAKAAYDESFNNLQLGIDAKKANDAALDMKAEAEKILSDAKEQAASILTQSQNMAAEVLMEAQSKHNDAIRMIEVANEQSREIAELARIQAANIIEQANAEMQAQISALELSRKEITSGLVDISNQAEEIKKQKALLQEAQLKADSELAVAVDTKQKYEALISQIKALSNNA